MLFLDGGIRYFDKFARKGNDVAHSIGVQSGFLHFYCLQEPFFDVSGHLFCFETRDVRLPC